MASSRLAQQWYTKSKEILKKPHMSVAQKLLAYKMLLRPILIYNWFKGRINEFKLYEIQSLERIFGLSNEDRLYDKYTDIDVTAYMKLQEIRWIRATGLDIRNIRRIYTLSKRHDDPTSYYIRASDKHKHNSQKHQNVPTSSQSSTQSSGPPSDLRRSRRLGTKKPSCRSGR